MSMELATAQALRSLLVDIDKQMDVIKEEARAARVNPEELRYNDGRYAMTDLLLAKSQALAGIAYLKTK